MHLETFRPLGTLQVISSSSSKGFEKMAGSGFPTATPPTAAVVSGVTDSIIWSSSLTLSCSCTCMFGSLNGLPGRLLTSSHAAFREFNLFVLPKPLVRFISNWSNTIPALSIPFCWRRRCARDLALDADLFLEIPAFVRFDVKADIIPLFSLGRGRDFSGLSTSKEGEDSRRAAREWTDLANYRMKVNGAHMLLHLVG